MPKARVFYKNAIIGEWALKKCFFVVVVDMGLNHLFETKRV
jgi:hypothetical protein